MKKITTTIILCLLAFAYMQAQNVLFVKGGPGSGGFFEGGSDEQLADITNFSTSPGNHGWGTFAKTLEDNGYNVSQVIEGPGGDSAVNFTQLNLAQYDIIVLGSNNASYNNTQVNAIEAWVKNGGGLLTISDANFGSDWCDASNSDQSFLDRFGIIVNQDTGTYVLRRNEGDFVDGNHPILQNVNSFDGEGVSPFTLASSIPNGVNVKRLVRAKGQIKLNNGVSGNNRCEGSRRNANNNDAALMVATSGSGKVVAHYDRNTFFNNNGAGTNITRFDNMRYMLNVFSWLSSSSENNNPGPTTSQTVSGELRRWHKITIDFEGPNTSETANPNPFSDYRLDVTFTHNGTGKIYVVPGFYSGCANPADNSCTSGKIWKVHFTPDRTGSWNWSATFKTGNNVAINGGGSSAGFMDGSSGTFTVAESNKSGIDHRAANKGRTAYVRQHYLRYVGTGGDNANGDWFIKAGADSPENTLAYDDFDSTPDKKSWQPHQQDYEASDASSYTWANGKGTELLGAINYLSQKGVNAFSFLTFSLNGDDKNVSPHLFNDQNNPNWGNVEKDRFDVSKLAQWERIFSYADKKGMFMHFKTLETENEKLMDDGNLGRERKLYYRELIARFSHHLSLNWNLSEESTMSSNVVAEVSRYVNDLDPYDHLIALHTGLGGQNSKYTPLLGNNSEVTGGSIQADIDDIHSIVKEWVKKSKDANRKWVVCNDEQGPSSDGVVPDSDNKRQDIRKRVLWATLLAGGMGVEYYYGYGTGDTDLSAQSHRSRDLSYSDAARALRFFNANLQKELTSMVSEDGVTTDTNDFVFANSGKTYAIYRPNGGATALQLPNGNNKYNVQWYNPRQDGNLTAKSTLGGNLQAPDNNDWVALITLKNGDSNDDDTDNDGVVDQDDLCGDTASGETVDADGCSESQKDDDNDGVVNSEDNCPNTPSGETVDENGCPETNNDDSDNDGVNDQDDLCTNTSAGEAVDAYGCSESQKDDDGDGVVNSADSCPNTPNGELVDNNGCPLPNDTGDCIPLEQNGIVAVEAENFVSQSKTTERQWYISNGQTNTPTPDPDPSHHNEASGGTYLEILPDTRVTHGDPLVDGVSFSNTPGQVAIIDYKIKFTNPGKYFVWVRAHSTGTEDNGVHVGINGTWPDSGQRLQWCDGKNQWTWESKQRVHGNDCGEEQKIYIDVPYAGEHTISFSMREDGFEMDKFILSQTYTKPSGNGIEQVLTNCEGQPTISLIGESTINLTVGDNYVEQGATATDSEGGNLTSDIVISGDVDTNTPGTYTVTYNVSDAAGNDANQITRTIIVTNACTIGDSCDDNDTTTENDVFDADCNCVGTAIEISQSAYQGTNALIPGKIEAENYDLGGQGIAYNDSSNGNNGNQYRTDNVDIRTISTSKGGYQVGWTDNGEWMEYTADVTAGEYNIELRASSGSLNPGAVKVALDGVSLGTINIESTGDFNSFESFVINNVTITGGANKVLRLTYEANNFDIDWIQFSQVADEEDTIEPIITLSGDSTINLNLGNTYVEQGATVWDNVDSYFNLQITGTVDTTTAGTYYVYYNVSDAAGNAAAEVIRTIIVSPNSGNQLPTASFSGISEGENLAVGSSIIPVVNASDIDSSIANVKLFLNDEYIRRETVVPYKWGHKENEDALLKNLEQGAYTLKAEVSDTDGGVTVITLNFTVGGDTTSNEETNLLPIHDAYLENNQRRYNTDIVRVENNRRVAYLMFDVSRFNGEPSNDVVLQFKVASDAGYGNVNVYLGTSNDWTENDLNRSNKPDPGKLVGSLDSQFTIGSLKEINLSDMPAITGDRLSLIIEATGGNDFAFSSKESGTENAPVLKYKLASKASKHETVDTIKVYPNPSSDRITLDAVANENTALWVYDIYGKVVIEQIVSPTSKTIEISELSTGLYFIFLDGVQRAKFIKE